MNEIGMQIFQETKAAYNWINRTCWLALVSIAAWGGSHAVTSENDLVGAWWNCKDEFIRLIGFVTILIIIAIFHSYGLSLHNKKRKKALQFLTENKFITDKMVNYFHLSENNLDRQYKRDKLSLLIALFIFIFIIALP